MIECIKSGGLEIAAHNASRPIPASAFLSREPLRTPIARKAVELLSDIGCGPNEPQANRSARVSQWFHHQSQSCKGHLCLARQAGDGPDRQRFVCRRVFRGNQDPAHQTRRERRDLPHGRIACAARNRLTHINGHRAPLFHQSHIHLGATGAAHSCQDPHHARATRRLGQRGHDLHSGDKGRRGASSRDRPQESHDGNFSNTFELVSRLRGCWTCPNGCSPLPTNSGAFLLRRVGWLLADIVSKVFLH